MLTVHHLNQSRSQRVLWALEELSLPYQIVRYQREKTMLAPPALKKSTRLENRPLLKITVRSSPNPVPSWSICRKPMTTQGSLNLPMPGKNGSIGSGCIMRKAR